MPAAPTHARATLLEGDIRKILISLTLPMALGIVFVIAIDLTDTLWVSVLGTDELAALSFCFPVIAAIMSASMGLGIGATSAIARAIGAGDEQRVRRLTTHSLILAFVIVAALSSIGLLTQRWLFGLLGAEGHLLDLVVEFMTIWFISSAFLVVPMIGSAAIRATGDMRTPMWIMFTAAVLNGVLDPILMFGWGPIPALGFVGAAYASLISRMITLVAMFWVLGRRLRMLEPLRANLGELVASWRTILSVGLPATLTNMLGPLAAGVMTSLIAAHGNHAVAAWGVCTRIDSFLMIPIMALGASLTPFVGQNWAADRNDRVASGLIEARRFAIAWGLGGWLLLALFGSHVGGLFSDDPEVVEVISLALMVIPASYAATGLVMVVSAAFNAIDQAVRATLISAMRSLLLAIPLAWLGDAMAGLLGLLLGLVVASLLTAVLARSMGASLFVARPPSAS
ncbi:MATE family efflux transporter [Nannocystaceae bacterium ST9]